MRGLMLAALLIGLATPAMGGPVMVHPIRGFAATRHLCTLTHCGRRCPKGEWSCNGKCIPKRQLCRVFS